MLKDAHVNLISYLKPDNFSPKILACQKLTIIFYNPETKYDTVLL